MDRYECTDGKEGDETHRRDSIENNDPEKDAEAASASLAEMLDDEDGGESQLTGE